MQPHLSLPGAKRILIPLPSDNFQANIEADICQSKELIEQAETLYAEAEALLLAELGVDALDLSTQTTYTASLSEATHAERLDAEFFQPKYYRVLDALHGLRPKALVPLGELLDTLTNGHTPRHHDLSVGRIRFLTAEHVSDFRIDFGSQKRILEEHHQSELSRTQLHESDLLLTIKGRIGNAAVVEHLPGPTNINQDVALLRLKPGYHPYYVAGFVNSLAGKAFVQKLSTGQINPFLGLGNLSKIPVPVFERERMDALGRLISEKVGAAYQAEKDARHSLKEAKRRVEQMVLRG